MDGWPGGPVVGWLVGDFEEILRVDEIEASL